LLQEEYRPFIASKLGISPSLIQLGRTNKTAAAAPVNFSHHDLWELSLIKTMLERPNIVNFILDFIDSSTLKYHQSEFTMAIQGETNEPKLNNILMSNSIRIFESDEALKQELIWFLIGHYTREYKKLNSEHSISYDQKSYLIRQFRDKIERLKRGELVPLT
jgi:DNA primase